MKRRSILIVCIIGALLLTGGISAGSETGTLFVWGDNTFGQRTNVPEGSDFTAVVAGEYHTVALREDGSLAAWGDNEFGQCNVPAGNDFRAIAAGGDFCLALKDDGSLAAWGVNSSGQCNVPAGNDFKAIAAGYNFCMVLKDDGSLAAWGANGFGQCDVPAGNDYVAISSGDAFSLALREDGSLVAWGFNQFGECDVPAENDFTTFSAGDSFALAIRTDGTVVGWGLNDSKQCDAPAGNDYRLVVTGDEFSGALRGNNSIVTWGRTWYGLDHPPKGDGYIALCAGDSHAVALHPPVWVNASVPSSHGTAGPASQSVVFLSDAEVSFTPDPGYRIASITDNGEEQEIENPYVLSDIQVDHRIVVSFELIPSEYQVNATVFGGHARVDPAHQTVGIHESATITLYPDAGYRIGAIFDNGIAQPVQNPYIIPDVQDTHEVTVISTLPPGSLRAWGAVENVPGGETYTAVAAGWGSSLTVMNGTLIAWGDDSRGQCNVPAGNDYVDIASGDFHDLALRIDGSVVAWGDNTHGQCDVPADIPFVAVSAAADHSLAIAANGSLVAWGDNTDGECDVPAGNDFAAIASGYFHNLALRRDGSIVAWGSNEHGECDVPAGNDFAAIAAGAWHSLALTTNGSIVAWGSNADGQCDAPAGTGFQAIDAGIFFSVAIGENGTLAAWGDNTYGQCDVPAGTFSTLACGEYHSVAITSGEVILPMHADFTAAPRSGDAPLTVQFTDMSSGEPFRWYYRFGDGYTSSSQNPVHTYRNPGTYTVTLSIMKMENNKVTSTTTEKVGYITVKGAPGGRLAASFTATPTTGAAPLTVTFTDTSTGDPTGFRYTFGDLFVSSRPDPVHTYQRPGSYDVQLTVWTTTGGKLQSNTTLCRDCITVY